jgi:peptide chain release factor 1
MLLVFDVGNTNMVLGIYENNELTKHWRICTDKEKTSDEYGMLIKNLFEYDNIDIEIRDCDLRIDTYCASGHGGQGVNTTPSAVRITHLPTNTVVTCQNQRSQIQNKAEAMEVLKARLYQMELEKQEQEVGSERRNKIGTGDRSEKIRTYNYPQNRVTDHRIGFSTMQLERVMDGAIDDIINALITEDQARKLRGE